MRAGGRGHSEERGGDEARWGGGEMRRLGVGERGGEVRGGGGERRPNCAEAGKGPSAALAWLDDVALPEKSHESGLEFVAGIALFRIHSCINHRQACARARARSLSAIIFFFWPCIKKSACDLLCMRDSLSCIKDSARALFPPALSSLPASITGKFGCMRREGGGGQGRKESKAEGERERDRALPASNSPLPLSLSARPLTGAASRAITRIPLFVFS